jgi:integrase/recombinase XerC
MKSNAVTADTVGCAACDAARIGGRFVNSAAYLEYERWMRTRGLAANTVAKRRQALAALAGYLGGVPLSQVTEDQIERWADSLEPHARATRAVYISHVRSYFRWAFDTGRYPSNPARRLPAPLVPRRMPRPITEENLADALNHAPARIRIWLVLAASAGLRACEVAGLRGENVRLGVAEPYIHVTSDTTKGVKERIIPLTPDAAAELTAARLPVRGPCWVKAGGGQVPPNLVSKLCNQHLHDLGIPDTLHSLRHRFLTEVQRAGHDLLVTMELAGHSTPATTAGYAKVAAEHARAAVLAVPRLPPLRVASAEGPDAA